MVLGMVGRGHLFQNLSRHASPSCYPCYLASDMTPTLVSLPLLCTRTETFGDPTYGLDPPIPFPSNCVLTTYNSFWC